MSELIGVRASAGSGKTYSLSLRYLKLLKSMGKASPENLRRIVAITFTNKAASEMKERIMRFLKEIYFETPEGAKISRKTGLSSKEAGDWLDVIIGSYSDFHVRTIDSLLFSIFRALSFKLGYRPEGEVVLSEERIISDGFDILLSVPREDGEWKSMWERAIETFLKVHEGGGFYPEKELKKQFRRLYPKVRENVAGNSGEALGQASFSRKEFIKAHRRFCETVEPLLEKDVLNRRNIFPLLKDPLRLSFAGRVKILKSTPDQFFKKNAKVDPKEKDMFSKALEAMKRAILRWELAASFERAEGYIPAVYALKAMVREMSKKEGIIPGSEHWTEAVLAEIRREGTIPLIYTHFACSAGKFAHFLIDEFQDTSREQWDALYPLFQDSLSTYGSLFAVGDPKQAIFQWRGGDWTLFDDVFGGSGRKYFPSAETIKRETLKENYRSHPSLVRFFNRLFLPLTDRSFVRERLSEMMLEKDAPSEVLEELSDSVVSAFSNHRQEAKTTGWKREARIKVFNVSGGLRKDEVVELVKRRFVKEVAEEWSRVGDVFADRSPIAVLVEKHDEAEEVSGWLIERGLPVVTENALRLRSSNVVKGVICLLHLIQNPEDEVSLLGFCASGIAGEDLKNDVWSDREKLRRKVKGIVEKIKSFQNRINPFSPYELTVSALDILGVRKRLMGDLSPHRPFVQKFMELSYLFELESGPNLSRFLEFWEKGGLDEKVELPEAIKAVRVMTIHKAKGLEFPVVFVPFTAWRVRERSPINVVGEGEGKRLVHLKKSGVRDLEILRLRSIAKDAQEKLNLLYVSVTRAMEALYLFITPYRGVGKSVSDWLYVLVEKSKVVEDKLCQFYTLG